MKIITVRCTAKPENHNDLLALCKNMIAPSVAEEGCVNYNFYQDVSDSNRFFFYEEWKDQAAIDFHFNTKHFFEFQPKFNALIDGNAILTIHTIE